MEISNIWWTHVSYNVNFIQECISNLLRQNSLVLSFAKEVPFYYEMSSILEHKITELDADRKIEYMDNPGEEPGKLLLERFCKREKRAQYRKGIGYPRFLGESKDISLNHYYIWVSNLDEKNLKKWIAFVSEYNKYVPKDISPCLFVLECKKNEYSFIQNGFNLKTLEYHYSTYDLYTYCSIIVSQCSMRTWKKHYVCELVVNLCNDNVEKCYQLIRYQENLIKDPYSIISEIDGVNYDKKYVEKKVWESQLKHVFPKIEAYRTSFIQDKYEQLEMLMPFLKSRDKELDNPFDIELGMIYFLIGEKKLSVDTTEYYDIDNFRNARNALAHLKTIDYELLCKIMDR